MPHYSHTLALWAALDAFSADCFDKARHIELRLADDANCNDRHQLHLLQEPWQQNSARRLHHYLGLRHPNVQLQPSGEGLQVSFRGLGEGARRDPQRVHVLLAAGLVRGVHLRA